ncbi:MAG: BlaI/MecI/CopY family transcriptional regulator [Bryobacterales bacterium]|nr:BlaI/MecI/CopY family transcriptional regulator [Bryobacterales bacterium]
MSQDAHLRLSRRERQMMEVLYRNKSATTAEVRAGMTDPPSYSAVRATLRILEEKGVVRHDEKGGAYVYMPVVPRERARRSALKSLIETFFDGSAANAAAALLGNARAQFSAEELQRLSDLIEDAKQEGNSK